MDRDVEFTCAGDVDICGINGILVVTGVILGYLHGYGGSSEEHLGIEVAGERDLVVDEVLTPFTGIPVND